MVRLYRHEQSNPLGWRSSGLRVGYACQEGYPTLKQVRAEGCRQNLPARYALLGTSVICYRIEIQPIHVCRLEYILKSLADEPSLQSRN